MKEKIKQLISWINSGLDFDSDKRAMGSGDSSVRINVSTNELGREFTISNMKGTTKKSHTFTHGDSYNAAVYSVIGSYYEDNRDAVYIFIYSTAGNDSILRFNYSDESFDKICWDHTGLGFDPDYPIADPYMLGDFLHWNPRTTSPRSINVQWAYYDHTALSENAVLVGQYWPVGTIIKYKNRVYSVVGATVPIDAEPREQLDNLTYITWTYADYENETTATCAVNSVTILRTRSFFNSPEAPFYGAPFSEITSDTDIFSNNIRGNTFQFSYRFYIPQQGYTISAPFSPLITNANDESSNGEVSGDIQKNNMIKVGFDMGNIGSFSKNSRRQLCEFAEILFRKNNDPQWYVAERVYYENFYDMTVVGSTYYLLTSFYNDRLYEVSDSASIEKQYNALPLLADSQWSLDGVRTAYGGITEGFDGPTGVDVELSVSNGSVHLSGTGSGSGLDSISISSSLEQYNPNDPPYMLFYEYETDEIVLPAPAGTSPYEIIVTFDGVDYIGYYSFTPTPSLVPYVQAIAAVIDTIPTVTSYTIAGGGGGYIIYFKHREDHSASIEIYDTVATDSVITKYTTFKTNSEHPFCLYYFDGIYRRSEPIVQSLDSLDGGTTIFVPSISDDGVLTEGTNHQQRVEWTINHYAPSWAKYWKWGYSGNRSISLFWQYNINGVTAGTAGLSKYALVEISSLQTITDDSSGNTNVHINSNIGSYVFEDGDRIKFLTKDGGTGTNTTNINVADSGYDYEIKGFDDVLHLVYIDTAALGGTPYANYNSDEVVVEIYRPKNSEEVEFYEYGELYSIIESGGLYLHSGQTQTQTDSLPATGTHNVGDVFLISREVANPPASFSPASGPIFMESYSWSDFYDSDNWGRGKIGVISRIGEVKLNNVRYGNKFSPNTLSSGMSEFDGLDYKSLSNDHGKIVAMRQAGHVLKVYFERNTASIMVNKAQFLDSDGVSQIVKSDYVLGTIEYSNYHYGTIFPESVFMVDRTVYFYDIYRKAYVRDASNGVFAISDYKAIKKFSDISDALLSSGVENVQVWTAYDSVRKYVYVMFKDSVTSSNDEVLVFNEKKNRWETTVELVEDLFVPTLVRNAELDSRLTSDSETAITVATIEDGYLTFNNLPPEFISDLQHPSGNDWLCVNLETFDTGGQTATSGDYVDYVIVAWESSSQKYEFWGGGGSWTNWSVDDEVAFIKPDKILSPYNGDNYMLDGNATYTRPKGAGMFVKSDGSYQMFVTSYDSQGSKWTIISANSTSPSSSWTESFTPVFDAREFGINPTSQTLGVTTYGNVVYLEDESKYLIPVSLRDNSTGDWHLCLFKCDEDFANPTYYGDVITLSNDSQDVMPSLAYYDGEYYLFFVEWDGSNRETDNAILKYVKSSDYEDFSSSTHNTILTGTTSADATSVIDNKWYSAFVDGTTAFVHHGMLYLMVNGVSRYDVSGNRNVEMVGLFEFDGSVLSESRYGVIFPSMFYGSWQNTTWGSRGVGAPLSWVASGDNYITSITQESSAGSDEKIGFGLIDIDSLFDHDAAVGSDLPAAIGESTRDLLSFIGEDIYIHNSNESRGYFYNSLKKMVLDIVVNEQPVTDKVLDSLSINTNDGEWVVTDIDIPSTASYPNGMSSEIPNVLFKKREGGIHSEFLRNKKTSSTTESVRELREGEQLRGQTGTITLTNDQSGEVVLYDVIINMSPSKI